jgi:hypothetical protein
MKKQMKKWKRRKSKKFRNRKSIWISICSSLKRNLRSLKRNLRSLKSTRLLNPNGREHDFKRRETREKVCCLLLSNRKRSKIPTSTPG